MKRTLGYGLLTFAAISIAFAVIPKRRPASQPPAAPAAPAPAPKPGKIVASARRAAAQVVIARYCHGHARCSNCLKIENYSREAIETGLRRDLDSGRLRFEVVNVEEPANRHYVQDYGLYTKSLVLVAQSGGQELRHKVLNDVWNYLSDKAAFQAYVRSETEKFLQQP
jgi:hypothetical protein